MLIIVLQREREGVLIYVKFYNRCSGQILEYAGIQYSSPTLCTAMLNLIPAFTFMLAIIFRSPLLSSDSQNEWMNGNCLICPNRKKRREIHAQLNYHFGSLDYWIHMSLMASYMRSKSKNAHDEWILAHSCRHFWNQACSLLSNWPNPIFNWIHLQMLKLCTIKLWNGAKSDRCNLIFR
jgi:hypothetical protein